MSSGWSILMFLLVRVLEIIRVCRVGKLICAVPIVEPDEIKPAHTGWSPVWADQVTW